MVILVITPPSHIGDVPVQETMHGAQADRIFQIGITGMRPGSMLHSTGVRHVLAESHRFITSPAHARTGWIMPMWNTSSSTSAGWVLSRPKHMSDIQHLIDALVAGDGVATERMVKTP
jgi:hypothetical protein